MILTPEAQEEFKADVLKRYPEEACGLVIGGKYFACTNSLPDIKDVNQRLGAFRISALERQTLVTANGPVQAVLHSHPYNIKGSRKFLTDAYNPSWPSVADQECFLADNCDWGIVASDGEGISEFCWLTNETPSLEKREFSWFTADCYTCIRDWHILQGRKDIPNFTREWEFWKKPLNTPGANVIEDGINTIPFAERIATEKAEIGDVAVFSLGEHERVNHLGVIIGSNEMLHQYQGRTEDTLFAHTVPWQKWAHRARYVVRFNKC